MGWRYPPIAFTEQGVAMLSSVLRSRRAVQVNIEIMRAFVRLRSLLKTHADLERKLAAMEKKYDKQFLFWNSKTGKIRGSGGKNLLSSRG